VVETSKPGLMRIRECKVPDLKTLDGVIEEGYDPNGIAGPTYYRITTSWYYSTILAEYGVFLCIYPSYGPGDDLELVFIQ
jgi:hypothetical protein